MPESVIISTLSGILYRLKAGCQWREIPVKPYFAPDEMRTGYAVYQHFNKWSS